MYFFEAASFSLSHLYPFSVGFELLLDAPSFNVFLEFPRFSQFIKSFKLF